MQSQPTVSQNPAVPTTNAPQQNGQQQQQQQQMFYPFQCPTYPNAFQYHFNPYAYNPYSFFPQQMQPADEQPASNFQNQNGPNIEKPEILEDDVLAEKKSVEAEEVKVEVEENPKEQKCINCSCQKCLERRNSYTENIANNSAILDRVIANQERLERELEELKNIVERNMSVIDDLKRSNRSVDVVKDSLIAVANVLAAASTHFETDPIYKEFTSVVEVQKNPEPEVVEETVTVVIPEPNVEENQEKVLEEFVKENDFESDSSNEENNEVAIVVVDTPVEEKETICPKCNKPFDSRNGKFKMCIDCNRASRPRKANTPIKKNPKKFATSNNNNTEEKETNNGNEQSQKQE